MAVKALEWWRTHKDSPGMDRSSRINLLSMMEEVYQEYGRIRCECAESDKRNGTETVKMWDEVFGEETKALETAIAEIERSLDNDPAIGGVGF